MSDPDASTPAADGRVWKFSGAENDWPMSDDPTGSPSTSTSEPSALSPKRAWATPVIAKRVGEAEQHGHGDEHAQGGNELATHHDTPRAEMTTSMILIPMNGATIPPRP